MRILGRTAASLLFFAVCYTMAPTRAMAQAVSYEDSSGGMHFVDSVAQVPKQYRNQVVHEKPNHMTKQQYQQALKDYNDKQKAEQREEQEEKKNRDRDEKQKRQKEQEEKRRAATQSRPNSSQPPTTVGTPIPQGQPTPTTR